MTSFTSRILKQIKTGATLSKSVSITITLYYSITTRKKDITTHPSRNKQTQPQSETTNTLDKNKHKITIPGTGKRKQNPMNSTEY